MRAIILVRALVVLVLLAVAGGAAAWAYVTFLSSPGKPAVPPTVFLIVMENQNWSDIKGNPSAPYMNQQLLPDASYAEQYYTPPGLHPSEPNYIWLEGGTNFGITNDENPGANHISDTNHLVTLLFDNGVSWKSYQEGISGLTCPVTATGLYVPRHNPMVYFDDVLQTNIRDSVYCISHVRPYSELERDLKANNVNRYNFITANLCNDMHESVECKTPDRVKNGDTWLSTELPKILNSKAYKDNGYIFITWDEGANDSDGPIGLIVLSLHAKSGGYSNTIRYTHSSTLRTIQEIFGVTPLLGDAANAPDLSDLFNNPPWASPK